MDIGTAKPDAATRARVPHHLIDVIDPVDAYSAARFRADAIAAIGAIRARGAIPLLVGGTMLYFKALTEGLSALPGADPAVRARLDARAAADGWPALHAELARVDPVTARRLKATDAQRIQRALEVHELAGRPLSELQGAREFGGCDGQDDPGRARAARSRRAASADRASLRCDARGGARGRARGASRAVSADARPAGDALRRLSPGLRVSRRARSMRRRFARPELPRRGNWRSGNSPGSRACRRRRSIRRRRTSRTASRRSCRGRGLAAS